MDLLTPSSPGSLPTLSLTTNSSWLPWERVAMPLISPLLPVAQSKVIYHDDNSITVKSSPPTNQYPVFTGWMSFLSPNQQCQSTEGKSATNITVNIYIHAAKTRSNTETRLSLYNRFKRYNTVSVLNQSCCDDQAVINSAPISRHKTVSKLFHGKSLSRDLNIRACTNQFTRQDAQSVIYNCFFS